LADKGSAASRFFAVAGFTTAIWAICVFTVPAFAGYLAIRSALRQSVSGVVCRRSEEEMIHVVARRVVALVANLQAGRDRAVGSGPRKPMREHLSLHALHVDEHVAAGNHSSSGDVAVFEHVAIIRFSCEQMAKAHG
jgi:hypothetical protein